MKFLAVAFALVLLPASVAQCREYSGCHPDTLLVVISGVDEESARRGLSETRMRRIFRDELERVGTVAVFDSSWTHLPLVECSLVLLPEDVRITYSISAEVRWASQLLWRRPGTIGYTPEIDHVFEIVKDSAMELAESIRANTWNCNFSDIAIEPSCGVADSFCHPIYISPKIVPLYNLSAHGPVFDPLYKKDFAEQKKKWWSLQSEIIKETVDPILVSPTGTYSLHIRFDAPDHGMRQGNPFERAYNWSLDVTIEDRWLVVASGHAMGVSQHTAEGINKQLDALKTIIRCLCEAIKQHNSQALERE